MHSPRDLRAEVFLQFRPEPGRGGGGYRFQVGKEEDPKNQTKRRGGKSVERPGSRPPPPQPGDPDPPPHRHQIPPGNGCASLVQEKEAVLGRSATIRPKEEAA